MKKLREVLDATRPKQRERAFGLLALAQLNNCKRSKARLQSEVSIRECERAPVPVYRKTKQLIISKTKRF